MADHPLRPATHRCLGRPLPYQLANETRAHPRTNAYAEASFTDFVKKPDYPVLAPLSRSYSKSKGRLPTRYSPVRHSTQGRSPFLVRLACVRHAASVHSEPESNSPVTYNLKSNLVAHKTLSSVLYAPTRYLFVKDPCHTGKRKSSLSTTPLTVKRFFQALSIFLRRAFSAKAGLTS